MLLSLASWVNGKPSEMISITDRGLSYGDGLFETIRIANGRQTLDYLHWQRLRAGARRLGITLDIEQVWKESLLFLESSDITEAVLKVIVTRGSGGRGYNAAGCGQASRIMSLHALPEYPKHYAVDGVNIRFCDLRLGQSSFAGLKHLNRLEQVTARSEWQGAAYAEGLLRDFEGRIIEGTMSNLFFIDHQEVIVTPSLVRNGVAGVCRQYIMEQARDWGMEVQEKDVFPDMLDKAREVFIANSVNGIWPVVSCDHRHWPVGDITRVIRDKVTGVLNA